MRWPVEETGKNSVKPSITPKIMYLRINRISTFFLSYTVFSKEPERAKAEVPLSNSPYYNARQAGGLTFVSNKKTRA